MRQFVSDLELESLLREPQKRESLYLNEPTSQDSLGRKHVYPYERTEHDFLPCGGSTRGVCCPQVLVPVSLLSPSVWEMEPSALVLRPGKQSGASPPVVSEQLSKTVEFLWLFTAMPALCKGPIPQVCGNNGYDVQSQKGAVNPHSGHSVSLKQTLNSVLGRSRCIK